MFKIEITPLDNNNSIEVKNIILFKEFSKILDNLYKCLYDEFNKYGIICSVEENYCSYSIFIKVGKKHFGIIEAYIVNHETYNRIYVKTCGDIFGEYYYKPEKFSKFITKFLGYKSTKDYFGLILYLNELTKPKQNV